MKTLPPSVMLPVQMHPSYMCTRPRAQYRAFRLTAALLNCPVPRRHRYSHLLQIIFDNRSLSWNLKCDFTKWMRKLSAQNVDMEQKKQLKLPFIFFQFNQLILWKTRHSLPLLDMHGSACQMPQIIMARYRQNRSSSQPVCAVFNVHILIYMIHSTKVGWIYVCL